MKKIFYSMMAVALCACSQSDVDDNVVAPQPETNGLKFVVVDNGFTGEDGTRVAYGEGTTAHFVNGDQIGLFVIKSMKAVDGENFSTPNECTASNIPLTLTDAGWTTNQSIDLTDATLLFAYAPYNAEAITDPNNDADWRLTFTGSEGNWEIDKSHDNRFFVGHNLYDDIKSMDFDKADWMGAVAKVPSDNNTVTFQMQHMRGMIEVNTPKGIEISKLTLAVGGENGAKYTYTKPYHVTTNDKEVYRILTTEYNNTNAIFAQIKDGGITKNYMKALGEGSKGAGVRSVLTISYTPAPYITVGSGQGESLAAQLGSTQPTSLRLAGTLSDTDWATLKSLTALTTLDMSELDNREIPNGWLNQETTLKETLTTLVLPNNLETIPWNSLQVKHVANIDLPATVKTIGNGAFYYCEETSFCIPANSQLTSIGDGAFWNAKAVYTDAIGVLKIPAGVTEILGNAFCGVKNLNKIIFQSTEAPAITNGDNQTIENNVLICVPNSDNYKNKSLFPGNAVLVNPLPLTADNYTAISTGEGSVAKLCDGIISAGNYWHSRYSGDPITYDKWGIYIDIALPTEQTSLKVFYTNRSGGNNFFAKKVAIGVKSAETEDYTELFRVENTETTKPLQEGAGASTVLESAVAKTDGSSYQYVRFAILQANGVVAENAGEQAANAAMATLAELSLAQDAWTE